MPQLTVRRATVWIGIALLVWFAYASGLWAVVAFLLVPLAFLVAVPRLGPWLLDHLGWRRLPRVGRLSGFAATLAILGLALAIGVSGNTLSPLPPPSARPEQTAAAAAGTAAPTRPPGVAVSLPSPSPSPTRTVAPVGSALAGSACVGKDARANVYHPDRLVTIDPCKTVTGTVMTLRREADGDWHIGLRLDPGQDVPLTASNLSGQGGNLVLEIICANTVTQADAVQACATYTNAVPVPTIGAHITATGPFVLDTQHGWNELHPLWAWTLATGATSTPVAPPPTPAAVTAPPAPAQTEVPTEAPAQTATPTSPHTAPPATPAPVSPTGVTFTFVSSPVARNATATATVATTAGASCTIRVTYASGPSAAQGLGPKSADANGVASWSWLVGARTTPGTWPIDVTCDGASAHTTFVVQ